MIRPKIAIDAQTMTVPKTGLGFYVAHLVSELRAAHPDFDYVLLAPDSTEDLAGPAQRFWWDQVGFPWQARKARADLVHQPAFSTPLLAPGKVVTTVHDIICRIFPGDLPFLSQHYFGTWMPFTHRFADHILADSDNTKRDLVRLAGIPADKITVVYLAANPDYRPVPDPKQLRAVARQHQIPGPYLAHVGTLNPRKNLNFLVRVFSRLARDYPKLSLVISGNKGWYGEQVEAEARRLGLSQRVIFTGYVSEEAMPLLLAGATIMTFPSLYEGFGLPPLDAMAAGVPVVSSSSSSLPEIVGAGGILLDPTDEGEWAKTIRRLLEKPAERRQWIAKGLKQAQKFSWERTVRETVAVYRRVLGTTVRG